MKTFWTHLLLGFALAACTVSSADTESGGDGGEGGTSVHDGGSGGDGGGAGEGSPGDGGFPSSVPYASNESLVTIPSTRTGVTLGFDLVVPASAPKRVVVLMAGGSGLLALSSTGIGMAANNFVVRTREDYASAGFAVAVPDAPSDHPQGLDDFRATDAHAKDLGAILAWLRAKWPGVKVFVIGTSRGTISTANVASRLAGAGGPDGIVLTSSITIIPSNATDQESLSNVDLTKVAGPVQIVHNKLDECPASPYSGAQSLARLLAQSTFVSEDGGSETGSDRCGALTYHGYYGIDDAVVPVIVSFVGSH